MSYYDAKAKKLVVNVVNKAAAERRRGKAGGKAKVVEHTLAQLDVGPADPEGQGDHPRHLLGASTRRANKVVVTADRTVKGAELDRLSKVANEPGRQGRA